MSRITLSFDNGPEPDVTPRVLDLLAGHGVKSTFFVLGHKMADPARRKLAERAHADGHWIGNHTWTHRTPLGLNADAGAPAAEIGETQRVLGALAHPDRLFRPFGQGDNLDGRILSPAARDYLIDGGYSCVLWNSVPGDWKPGDDWYDNALNDAARDDWTLMVLHDLPDACIGKLDDFLKALSDAGHDIVQEFPPSCVPISCGEYVRPDAMPPLADAA